VAYPHQALAAYISLMNIMDYIDNLLEKKYPLSSWLLEQKNTKNCKILDIHTIQSYKLSKTKQQY